MSIATRQVKQSQRSLRSYLAQAAAILAVATLLMIAVHLASMRALRRQAVTTAAGKLAGPFAALTFPARGQWRTLGWTYTNSAHELCATVVHQQQTQIYLITMFHRDEFGQDSAYWESPQQFPSDEEALRLVTDVCDNKSARKAGSTK